MPHGRMTQRMMGHRDVESSRIVSISLLLAAGGIQNLYCLVFLCMKTREVIVSSSTQHPNSAWVKGQTEAFIEQTADRTEKPAVVMHNRDTKFTKDFVALLKAKGIRTNALPVASPNLNGRVERFIQSIKRECLR